MNKPSQRNRRARCLAFAGTAMFLALAVTLSACNQQPAPPQTITLPETVEVTPPPPNYQPVPINEKIRFADISVAVMQDNDEAFWLGVNKDSARLETFPSQDQVNDPRTQAYNSWLEFDQNVCGPLEEEEQRVLCRQKNVLFDDQVDGQELAVWSQGFLPDPIGLTCNQVFYRATSGTVHVIYLYGDYANFRLALSNWLK